MSLRGIFVLALLVGFSGCASAGPPLDPMWALIKAPARPYFPYGSWSTPKDEWLMVEVFPTQDECQKALERRLSEERLRPLNCIATTSPEYQAIAQAAAQ